MTDRIFEGPQQYPSLHPVMANAFENPLIRMVLSRMPGIWTIETWSSPV